MNINDPTIQWYSLKEAAAKLHRSYDGTYDLVKSRRLGAVQVGRKGRILISSKHIDDFHRRWELRPVTLDNFTN